MDIINKDYTINQDALRDELRRVAIERGISLRDIAIEVGVSSPTILRFLAGKSVMPKVTYLLIKFINKTLVSKVN